MLPTKRQGLFYPNIPAKCLELSSVLRFRLRETLKLGYFICCSALTMQEWTTPACRWALRWWSHQLSWWLTLHASTEDAVYASHGLELFIWHLVPQLPILSVYKKPYNIYSIFYTDKNRRDKTETICRPYHRRKTAQAFTEGTYPWVSCKQFDVC